MDISWSNAEVLGEVGRRLQTERLNRNLTQQQLADLAGLSRATVTNFEGGKSVSFENLVKMMRALGIISRLDTAFPEPEISPIQLAELRGRERRRAAGTRSRSRQR